MASQPEDETLDPKRARELIASEEARIQVLDLRDEDEFTAAHIAGAVRSDRDEVESALESFDQDRPVVVVCEDGERSAAVAVELRDHGYQAAVVKGGMKAWSDDSLPTQPREAEEFHGPRRAGPLGQ
jgi:rhodanese-related sulfurtransferase